MRCYACGFVGPSSKKEGRTYKDYFNSVPYAYRGNSCHPGLVYDGSFYSCPKCGTIKKYVESDNLKINGGDE